MTKRPLTVYIPKIFYINIYRFFIITYVKIFSFDFINFKLLLLFHILQNAQ